ncbi:hypothetical protein GOP47_0004150 [Adiantum capillus-veneris]|uniref:Uncharacterized protein n=1 Tax=Adiantum capillus-veneris TaxID=13818 RepID=A0A9D4V8R5_ADICA|nr:hypothetical protein GOP47_0004150 [Adiantum capillus-veneris]
MHLLCTDFCRRRRDSSAIVAALIFIWLSLCSLSIAVADLHGAAGSLLLSERLAQASSLRTSRLVYSPISTSTDEFLLKGWSRNLWRKLASAADDGKEEEDYIGDYSPSSNVDGGVAAAPPPNVIGNKRKLLQDYVPIANASPPSPDGRK